MDRHADIGRERGTKPGRSRFGFALIAGLAVVAAALHAAGDARLASAGYLAPSSPAQQAQTPTGAAPDGGEQPTFAPPPPTPFQTPTPGADGTIIYVVQPGDTLWRIASLTGVSVDQLRSLNGLTSDVLSVGQSLVIARGAAPAAGGNSPPAAASAATSSPPPPAGTNQAPSTNHSPVGSGTVCALLWDDADGDGVRNAGEGLLRGGRLTVVEIITGRQVQAYTTDGASEPHCFNDLPAGQYTVSAAVPAGYSATTITSAPLEVADGSVAALEFGAQAQPRAAQPGAPGPQALGQPAAPGLPLTGIAVASGAILILLALLASGGLAFWFWRRPRSEGASRRRV